MCVFGGGGGGWKWKWKVVENKHGSILSISGRKNGRGHAWEAPNTIGKVRTTLFGKSTLQVR